MKKSTKKMVYAGLLLAIGMVLPFLTAQVPSIGSKLLPMHLPVLLAGFVCGWPYGLIVGFILPLFRSLIFGMPPMIPTATAMAFELAAYGFLTGILYPHFPKKKIFILLTLVISMLGGRIVWGFVSFFLYGINNTAFSWQLFASGAFINAIPGIIIQLLLIPVIVIALEKGKIINHE